MHRVTTGRLIAAVTAAGDTVLGTVPAGRVWQIISHVNVSGPHLAGAIGEIRFLDSAGVIRERVAQITAGSGPQVGAASVRIILAAGDKVVYHSSNASTWGVLVSYFER